MKISIIYFLTFMFSYQYISLDSKIPGLDYFTNEYSFVKKNKSIVEVKNIHILEKRKEIIGEVNFWEDISNCESKVILWSYDKKESDVLISLNKNEILNFLVMSQDEENLVLVTYSMKKSEIKPIVGCFNISLKKWLWKFELQDLIGDSYIRNISFQENTNKIVALLAEEIIYVDLKTGRIIERKKANMCEYDYRGEVLELHTKISRSGRYYVIWNYFSGGGLLPDWFYPKGNRFVSLWDVVEDKEKIRIEKKLKENWEITFSDDENNLIIFDGKIKLWSIKENKLVYEKELVDDLSQKVKILRNDIIFKINGDLFLLKYSDMNKTIKIETSENPELWCAMDVSRDGKLLAFEKDGKLYLYKTKNWKKIWNVSTSPEDTLDR